MSPRSGPDDSEPPTRNLDGSVPLDASPADSATMTVGQQDGSSSTPRARPGHTDSIPPESAIGTFIGSYLVIDHLGAGGMGRVYRAFDRRLDRQVALKVLHRDLESRHRDRLVREARALAKLSHPNVVQVHEVSESEGRTFVAMELASGQTLRRWVAQDPRPGWRECVEAYRQAGAGLVAAHEHGLVHRDFKPSNAIIDYKGRVRVLDFGLARTSANTNMDERGSPATSTSSSGDDHGSERLTQTGIVMGTPGYMSIEQIRGEEVDARSDQFSFCVSLYEAVYGRRPFPGRTIDELEVTIGARAFVPVPSGARIPTKLRELLVRGLAAKPDDRWPSMDALLAELQRLVSPRSRSWWVLGAGVTLGLATLGAGMAYRADVAHQAALGQRCSGARAQLDGVWDEARRQQVQDAILGVERPYASDVWARVEPRLDEYADAWASKHTEVCEATSIRQEQTEEMMGLRMTCLYRRRAALKAAIDVLARADAQMLPNTVSVARGLPSLDPCDDVAHLEQQGQRMPPPEDPEVARQVEVVRDRLAQIGAERLAGQYAQGLEHIEVVVEQARALDYGPLLAEVLFERGLLLNMNGQYLEAEQELERALEQAAEHGNDRAEAMAMGILAWVVGSEQDRHGAGMVWGKVALARSWRLGQPARANVQASALNIAGLVHARQGKLDDALHYFQRTLAVVEESLGPRHPQVSPALNSIGVVLANQGKFDDALLLLQRSLTLEEEELGPHHPAVAGSLVNIGDMLVDQGKLDDARLHFQRALKVQEEALGPRHPHVVYPLIGLTKIALKQHDTDTSRRHAERAVSIGETTTMPPTRRASARFLLARSLWPTPHERPRARALAEQSRDAYVKDSVGHKDELAEVEQWLAEHGVP
ncbi:MAG: serine/threonine-protein kinase [Myxococcota bacterium]